MINPGYALQPHQVAGVEWLLGHPRAVLADDVGLGKTAQALGLIDRLVLQGDLQRAGRRNLPVLWLTEASLIEQTRGEFEKFLPGRFEILTSADPESGTTAKAKRLYREKFGSPSPWSPDVRIMSYDMANSRREWLHSAIPGLVVLDEAGMLRGGKWLAETVEEITARTVRSGGRVVAMTASPYQNDPTELYAVLRAAQTPNLWPRATFDNEFVTWRQVNVTRWGTAQYEPDGWVENRVPEVNAYLAGVMLRRTAENVGPSLPRVERVTRWVPLTAEQSKAYDAALRAYSDLAAHQWRERAGRLARHESSLVDELIRQLGERDGQAIVCCETLDVLDLAAEALTEAGVSFRRIEGSVSQVERQRAIEQHRKGGFRVLLGSRVLEHGLNLQHCPMLISLDSSWNPTRERQREGRIARMGSRFDSVAHITLLPDTPLARKKIGKLQWKSEGAAKVGL